MSDQPTPPPATTAVPGDDAAVDVAGPAPEPTPEPAPAPASAACPHCGAPVSDLDQFCESCGGVIVPTGGATDPDAALDGDDVLVENKTHRIESVKHAEAWPAVTSTPKAPARPCGECGGDVADDGYCSVCGARAVSERDHFEERPASWVGGVCDKGVRHARNEDGMALAADDEPGSRCVIVVCDGVSSAPNSDLASLAAAIAARDVLARAHADAPSTGTDLVPYWTAAIESAVDAAHGEVVETAAALPERPVNPPSCTFVCAVLHGPVVIAGWIGDSRAYWLPDHGVPAQLTIDDSWVTEQIELGMARSVAEADSRAHSITRWLGADATDWRPRCSVATPDSPGWLLVCSDGLWNYCSEAVALRERVQGLNPEGAEAVHPAELAARIVSWANSQGGHDNVTVALARVPGPDSTTVPAVAEAAASGAPAMPEDKTTQPTDPPT